MNAKQNQILSSQVVFAVKDRDSIEADGLLIRKANPDAKGGDGQAALGIPADPVEAHWTRAKPDGKSGETRLEKYYVNAGSPDGFGM